MEKQKKPHILEWRDEGCWQDKPGAFIQSLNSHSIHRHPICSSERHLKSVISYGASHVLYLLLLVPNDFLFSWGWIQYCFLFPISRPYGIYFCISISSSDTTFPLTLQTHWIYCCCFQICQICSIPFRIAVSPAYTFHSWVSKDTSHILCQFLFF